MSGRSDREGGEHATNLPAMSDSSIGAYVVGWDLRGGRTGQPIHYFGINYFTCEIFEGKVERVTFV